MIGHKKKDIAWCRCNKCGNFWEPKKKCDTKENLPKQCPKCKRTDWNNK